MDNTQNKHILYLKLNILYKIINTRSTNWKNKNKRTNFYIKYLWPSTALDE
jgi:hypothetical protein